MEKTDQPYRITETKPTRKTENTVKKKQQKGQWKKITVSDEGEKNASDKTSILFYFLFSFAARGGHHNSVSQLLWARIIPNPPCQLSLWEQTGVPGENPRLSAEH